MHTKKKKKDSGSWKWASFGFVLFFGLLSLISSPGAKIWQHARYSALFKKDQILYSLLKNYFRSYPPKLVLQQSLILVTATTPKWWHFIQTVVFLRRFFLLFCIFITSVLDQLHLWLSCLIFFFPPISFVTLTSNCFGKLCMLTKIFKILNFQLELKEGNIKHGFKTEGEWLSLGTTSKLRLKMFLVNMHMCKFEWICTGLFCPSDSEDRWY